MATKEKFKSLQKGNFGGHLWQLLQSNQDRNEYELRIIEQELIEKEEISEEVRKIPKEESVKRPVVGKDGQPEKDDKGKIIMETVIKKTHIFDKVKVSEIIRVPKYTTRRKFTFYFRPFHFQVVKTIRNYIQTLDD